MNYSDTPIVAARRKRLQSWIDQHHDRSQTAFAIATKINPGELSGLLRTKSFGEKRAASIEAAAGMPSGFLVNPTSDANLPVATDSNYLRVQLLDVEAGMGGERFNSDHPDILREVDISKLYIRDLMGFVPVEGRLALMMGRGDSMMPTIEPGEMMLVDTGMTRFEYDSVYAINLGNGLQVKRLMDTGTSIHVCSDNPLYPAFPLPENAQIVGKVVLRARLERLG